MEKKIIITTIVFFCNFHDALSAKFTGDYFYKEIGCVKKDGRLPQYECPNSSINDTCHFRNSVFKHGEEVDKELLRGSCHAVCHCGDEGRITCANHECSERLKSGCSHFKYSLDTCCEVDSICGPIDKCTLDGDTYQEGEVIYPKNLCEVCICDVGFKKESPFCRPRRCFDQATHQLEVSRYGAPVFFKNENCCPSTWIVDNGEQLIKINPKAESNSDLFCKYGNRTVRLGYGFEKNVKSHGKTVPLKCECTIPPFMICVEK